MAELNAGESCPLIVLIGEMRDEGSAVGHWVQVIGIDEGWGLHRGVGAEIKS